MMLRSQSAQPLSIPCVHDSTSINYVLKRVLRNGGQGTVTLAVSSQLAGLEVAYKTYLPVSCPAPTDLLEKLCLGDVARKTIVQILDFSVISQTPKALVMEYCAMGDLLDFLMAADNGETCLWKWSPTAIPEVFVWHVFQQLADALDFLHTGYGYPKHDEYPQQWTAIIHRDIKSENVLLTEDPNRPGGLPLIKLTDFDMADFYDPLVKPKVFKQGTSEFQPPEQWSDPKRPIARPEGDIWAVGSVIHQICTAISPREYHICDSFGCFPESELSPVKEVLYKRSFDRILDIKKISPPFSEDLDQAMNFALTILPEKRPNASTLRRALQQQTKDMQEEMDRFRMPDVLLRPQRENNTSSSSERPNFPWNTSGILGPLNSDSAEDRREPCPPYEEDPW